MKRLIEILGDIQVKRTYMLRPKCVEVVVKRSIKAIKATISGFIKIGF